MLIILEGPDRAGKSTLAHAIADKLRKMHPLHDIRILHARPPKFHPLADYEESLLNYRPHHGKHIICDRWHIGELVYPTICDRSTLMTPAVFAHIEMFLQSRGALLVFVSASKYTLCERLREENNTSSDSLVNEEQLIASYDLFIDCCAKSRLPQTTIDTSSVYSVSDDKIDDIIITASELSTDCIMLNNAITYVGPHNPDVIFLGDVRHYHRDFMRNVAARLMALSDKAPAFVPLLHLSGEFFLNALVPNILNTNIGLMNANDVDNPYVTWNQLGNPTAIALGRNAWNTTKEWSFGAVPHPQYVKRFYSKDSLWYNELINNAIKNGGNLIRERPKK